MNFASKYTVASLADVTFFSSTRSEGIFFISTSDLQPGKTTAIPGDTAKSGVAFQKGDFLLNNIRPYLKKYWLADRNGVCSSDVIVIRPIAGKISENYLASILSQNNFYNYIMSGAVGTKMPRGDRNHIKQYPLPLPSLPEQEKIANFLSALDERISLQEERIRLLSEQKKGYTQQIFNRQLQFRDDNGNEYPEWEAKRLDSFLEFNMGFTPSTKDQSLWKGSEHWLSIAGMKEKYISNGNKRISEKASKEKTSFPSGTLIMSFKLSVGKLAILRTEMFTNEAICGFKNKDTFCTEYLYYALSNIDISSFGSRAVKGITLNSENIGSIVVPFPSLSEQEKIASFLSVLDEQISLEKEKLELYKQEKQGYSQRIFNNN